MTTEAFPVIQITRLSPIEGDQQQALKNFVRLASETLNQFRQDFENGVCRDPLPIVARCPETGESVHMAILFPC